MSPIMCLLVAMIRLCPIQIQFHQLFRFSCLSRLGCRLPHFGLSFSPSTILLCQFGVELFGYVQDLSHLVLTDVWLNYLFVVTLKSLSGSRLSYGSSGRPLIKTLIEKDASFAEKAKVHSLVSAIYVEACFRILLCGQSLWCTSRILRQIGFGFSNISKIPFLVVSYGRSLCFSIIKLSS